MKNNNVNNNNNNNKNNNNRKKVNNMKKVNNNKKEEKKPLLTEKINLSYTKGIYSWYCKTVLTLYVIVMNILNKAGKAIKTAEYVALVNCLWIVNHMSLKLEGICSISSSVTDNCLCSFKRKIEGCICKYCYAFNQQSYQTGLKEHNILNGIILRNILIPVSAFKYLRIIFPYIRIESFGDVANVTQARNYIRIIKAFKDKRCAIWSKNIAIWSAAFKLEGGKPKNTTYVHSSHKINIPDVIDLIKYPFVDHIFTVFTKAYAKKHNIIINCGGRKCLECIRKRINCYFSVNKKNNTFYINELKK